MVANDPLGRSSAVPMKDATRDAIALRRQLSVRLKPLAFAIGVLISLGLPLTYYVLQYNALRLDADTSAGRLAARLPGPDPHAVVSDFSNSGDVVTIRILDTRGATLAPIAVVTPLADRWWNRLVPTGVAPVIVAGETIGTVEVRLSQGALIVVTAGLFLISTLTGVVLACLVYAVPVRVVGGMEGRVRDLITEQESLISAGRALASSLDLRDVLERFAEAARSLPGIDVVRIWLCDPVTGVQTLVTQSGHHQTELEPPRTLGHREGLSGIVIDTRQPLVLAHALRDPRLRNKPWYEAEKLVSYLGVPLLVGDTALGALSCMSRVSREFSSADIALAETLGSLAAVAIRNATTFGEMTRRGDRLRAAADLARAVSGSLELTAVLRQVVAAVATLRARVFCIVRLVDHAAGGYRVAGRGGGHEDAVVPVLRFGEGLTHLVAESGRPLLVLDATTDPRTVGLDPQSLREFPIYYGVPIQSGETLLGVLSVSFATGAPPTADERESIELYAGQAAVAIRNAQLYAEAMRREREAEALARIARVLSESLDVADVGERTVEGVLPLFEGRSSGLYTLAPDGSFRGVAWGGDARTRYTPGQRFPAGEGLIGWLVTHATHVASADVLSDPRFIFPEPRRSELAAGGNTAVLAVALRAKGALVGVLAVADKPGRVFSEAELALLQAFADQAALALENARLYYRAQQAYAELTEAQDRLVRGETLRAMGELAAGVAHHVNNLLAVILGRIQLALGKEPPADLVRHLRIAERATLDGAEVIRRMRGFGRSPAEPDFAPVDLNRLAEEILELTRPRWEDEAQVRGITIQTRIEAGVIPAVRGEAGPLREVLMNLVLNAVDAMPEGGRITILTWVAAGWVHCTVADTGIGMTPEVQRRALEPFFTTKGVKSTGLGLSVNYGIVQRLGGDLTVDSIDGRGTSITFKLPTADRPAPTPAAPLAAPPRALRVLVIDDEREVRAMLADLLAAEGHEVVEAASGAEGLRHLEGDDTIDVVLSDLGMPGMTGWEVARAVKKRHPHLPVVLITGWGENPEGGPDDRSATDAIIAKPVTPVSLRAVLARAAAG